MKSYGVTIQMKPRQLYFHMVLFIAMFLYKRGGTCFQHKEGHLSYNGSTLLE